MKDLKFGKDARDAILSGVEQLNKAVSATMGPKGRNVLVQKKYGRPMATKDGVTVAREINLKDKFEDMGAEMVKEAATKTNDAAGDGTTTATVLAHAIMSKGMKHIKSGSNAIVMKRGIDKAVQAVVDELDKMKTEVSSKEEYKAVATISSQDEKIGEIIADAIDTVGQDGVIVVDKGNTTDIQMQHIEGMQIDKGWLNPYFVTDREKGLCEYEHIKILVTDYKITSAVSMVPIMEQLKQQDNRLVVICEDLDGDAYTALTNAHINGVWQILPIKAPAFGDRREDILKDIATVTGARFISEKAGLKLENCTPADLGSAKKVIARQKFTTILDGEGTQEDRETRITEVKAALEQANGDYETEKLKERLARLSNGVILIKVGATTEVEQKEKQHRVEDALAATRSAAEEGIVAGGGTAYIRCLKSIPKMDGDEEIGADIVREALTTPLCTIAENSGQDPLTVLEQVEKLKDTEGFNALTGEYCDLLEAMVIDPKKVTRCALQNAASVGGMFLTLEAAVALDDETITNLRKEQ